jgi:hypothetical protein
MTYMELYWTLAASSRTIQLVETPSSIQSGDTNGNGGFQDGDGGLVQEPLESCQERSYGDSCNPRSLRQQVLTKAYHITKRKELDEK